MCTIVYLIITNNAIFSGLKYFNYANKKSVKKDRHLNLRYPIYRICLLRNNKIFNKNIHKRINAVSLAIWNAFILLYEFSHQYVFFTLLSFGIYIFNILQPILNAISKILISKLVFDVTYIYWFLMLHIFIAILLYFCCYFSNVKVEYFHEKEC